MGAVFRFAIVAYFVAWPLGRALGFTCAARGLTFLVTERDFVRDTAFALGAAWLPTVEAIAPGAPALRASPAINASSANLLFMCFLPFEVS